MTGDHDRTARRRLNAQWLIAVLLALLWLAVSQHRLLMEPDEGRYAEIPREMLVSGDWILPHLDGIAYLEKPPLQYWATALAFRIFGTTQGNSRLWTVSLGLLGLCIIYAIGKREFGARAGRYAALIAASSPLYVFIAQINVLDMGLAFFLTAALGCFLRAQHAGASRRWMWLCWLALSLGFMQKGLVAFALPAIALAAYSLLHRDPGPWRRLQPRAGVAIVALCAGPWLYLTERASPGFLRFFFIHEHLLRFATTLHARVQPWWFFGAVLLAGTLPWIVVLGEGIRLAWLDVSGRQDAGRANAGSLDAASGIHGVDRFHAANFLLIWAASIVLFFSCSGSKLMPYVVPAIAPLALLGGLALTRSESRPPRWSLFASPALLAALCLTAPALAARILPAGVLQQSYGEFARSLALAGAVMAGSLAAALLIRRRDGAQAQRPAVTLLAVGFCLALSLIVNSTNSLEPARGGPSISAALRPYLAMDHPFYCVGMYPQTVIFALGRTCVLVEYHGELMPQLSGGAAHWVPSLSEFAQRWSREPDAVAIVDPQMLARLSQSGISLQRDSENVVAVAVHQPGGLPANTRTPDRRRRAGATLATGDRHPSGP